MEHVSEKDFKLRASQLGATKFTESHLEHTMSFLGEPIPYTVLLDSNKKSKIIALEGEHSVKSVAKAMSEVFKKRKLPNRDAAYFENKLLNKNPLSKYFLFEGISRTFMILCGSVLIALLSIMALNEITGYAAASIFDFTPVETSFFIGIIVFFVSLVVLFKIFSFKK